MDDHSSLDPSVAKVVTAHNLTLRTLNAAAERTRDARAFYRDRLLSEFKPDEYKGVDVVLFGSIARGDVGSDSDCDYLVVVNDLNVI